MTTTTPTISTHTIAAPGAVITYDVREGAPTSAPPLLLIGLPMGAAGFGTLAGHFADRTVLTYDPRGVERSQRSDGAGKIPLDQHAHDVHRLISEIGGPVDVFGSSGGAVVALALAARYPVDVATVVAHEPPNAQVLPDRDEAIAASRAVVQTYQQRGWGHAMAHFVGLVSQQGPIPADWGEQPAPDPSMFGMPAEDNGQRDDVMFAQNLMSIVEYELDFDPLRAARSRIILAAGEESGDILAARAALAIAERLGTQPVMFPGDHSGFMGGEYGQMGKPDEFVAKLREVLAAGG
jgi:pimeloyl-ACP methyl ester carboxylesterase